MIWNSDLEEFSRLESGAHHFLAQIERAEILVAKDADEATARAEALAQDGVQRALEGRAVKKFILVPNRIVNIVA